MHPDEDMNHGPVVDYVESKYKKLYERKPRDTWREIRRLHQEGFLIKVKKGIYRYSPESIKSKELLSFPEEIKQKIFERDGYRCVVCGKGLMDGVEIHADHIKPLDKGGDNSLENGQTLCSQHNLLKKNYSQTEFGKRLLIKLYEKAKRINDEKMLRFCKSIFDVYDEYDVDTHIIRPDKND